MVTSELRAGIVWIIIEGQLTAQDIIAEATKWQSQTDALSGFITDLRLDFGHFSVDHCTQAVNQAGNRSMS